MKIAWVIDSLKLVGGAQRGLLLFAKVIQGKNIHLTVVSLQDNLDSPLIEELENYKAEIVFFPGKNLRDPARILKLTRFFKKEKFDVIHTHLTYANILGIFTGRITGTPVVATLHSAHVDNIRFSPMISKVEAFLLRYLANQVIAVGYATAVVHKSRLKNRPILVVQNGIEIPLPISSERRAALRKEMIGYQTRVIIVAVGRLVEEKGYFHLIQAFSMLHDTHPDTALVFVGSGSLENKLRTHVESAGLANHVTFLGTRRDVPDLLASSDILVNSSIWEGLPYAILEGMAAGLPVVATDVGDNAKVVVNGTGLVVPPEQPRLLCEALSTLVEQPELMKSYGSAAKTHVTQNHGLITWLESLLVLYRSVLPGSKNILVQKTDYE